MADYIPRKESNLTPWANNLKQKLSGYAETLGLTSDEVTSAGNSCESINKDITNAVSAVAAAKKANKQKDMTIKESKVSLRDIIQRIKKSEGYTSAIGADLKIVGSDTPFNPDDYKTVLSAKVLSGKVSVKFIKKGVQGVNLYSRYSGTGKWEKLDFVSRSPYADRRALAVAGTAEVRQYMAIGVVKDAEIGLMSDIVEVVYGG